MNREDFVQLVHALPRRARLRVPLLVGHPGACASVARVLAREGGYARVTARPSTGSILVESDEGETVSPDVLIARLRELVAEGLADDGRPLTAPRPEPPGPTRVARAIAHAFTEINVDVRHALGGRADLGTLLPVVFAGLGVVEVLGTRKLPAPQWFNLLWWSVRAFMTFNPGAVEDEARAQREREVAEAAATAS